jgi:hypothetical protein
MNMSKPTVEQQLKKVMTTSRTIEVLLQIAQALAGVGIAVMLISLFFANSFQLSMGNGEFDITFLKQDQPQVIIDLYNAHKDIGENFEAEQPQWELTTRLETEPTAALRVAAGVPLFIKGAMIMQLLYFLSQLFAHYAKGEIFTSSAVAYMRKVGYTLLGFPIVALLNFVFAGAIAQMVADGKPWGPLHIVGLSLKMELVCVAVVVLLISWVMDVGRAQREENELTI